VLTRSMDIHGAKIPVIKERYCRIPECEARAIPRIGLRGLCKWVRNRLGSIVLDWSSDKEVSCRYLAGILHA
jgi:hypothetical protein